MIILLNNFQIKILLKPSWDLSSNYERCSNGKSIPTNKFLENFYPISHFGLLDSRGFFRVCDGDAMCHKESYFTVSQGEEERSEWYFKEGGPFAIKSVKC